MGAYRTENIDRANRDQIALCSTPTKKDQNLAIVLGKHAPAPHVENQNEAGDVPWQKDGRKRSVVRGAIEFRLNPWSAD
jgi:hypothetical protein